MEKSRRITLALTGASGAPYGLRLLELLLKARCDVSLLVSDAARVVVKQECGIDLPEGEGALQQFLLKRFQADGASLTVYGKNNWFAPVASGSSSPAAMVICPCSGGSLSALACGASNNLIERAADVALKERRQLILVPREAPYSDIHLENMLKLSRMGAVVIPASPGFYHHPQTIDDLVDFVVARILDQLGIGQDILARWGSDQSPS